MTDPTYEQLAQHRAYLESAPDINADVRLQLAIVDMATRCRQAERWAAEYREQLRRCEEARRYYAESLCRPGVQYALKAGGATPAINAERIGSILDQRDEAVALLRESESVLRDYGDYERDPLADRIDALLRRVGETDE